ncbi:unnamed protein product [Notodromas monacha]|uniref:Phospholipase A-2-activating protein n=1 Tax=Notodromas monacha TaxID=399045 RepID=A0A7R9BGW4_9CRUS|nr:unnamed protein product [Notodromas monacha]CAG0915094.1 unnamed protein product [Notodromas monacha]
MPLTINGIRLDDTPRDGRSLFLSYPFLKDHASALCALPTKLIGPVGLLYVCQREFAATVPHDKNITLLGTEEATTCHVVVLRHSGSGAVSLGHFDGSCSDEGVISMIQRVQELSLGYPEGRLEVHIVGGFHDGRGRSDEVLVGVLYALHKQPLDVEMVTACFGDVNTTIRGGIPWPIIYGIAVNVKTGEICPATFPEKGPALALRGARTFTGGHHMLDVYDANLGLMRIGPFNYEPLRGVDLWLQQSDDFILQHLSTSPEVEPPHFAMQVRATLKHIQEHPFPSVTLFPDNRPHFYRKDEAGNWIPVRKLKMHGEASFKLSTTIVGHTNDVKCIAFSPSPNGILTASRDKTAKFWALDNNGREYSMAAELSGHKHYVNAVVAIGACEQFPLGAILTGSMDGVVRVYGVGGGDPVRLFEGHKQSVTCLAVSSGGLVLSGSWDFSMKVWLNKEQQPCSKTLVGHTMAVWSVTVMPGDRLFASASADKSIRLWNASDGTCVKTLLGHEDVVRCVVAVSPTELFSAANDSSVRRWNIDGSCLGVYPGHEPFTYCISFWKNGEFATCGEDRVVRVWKNFQVVQNVHLPTLTNWSIACLPNGDFAVGGNDGMVRVFSRSKERWAPAEELQIYEDTLKEVKIQAPELEGLDTDNMPGPEALLNPGMKDGQNRFIKENGVVNLYSWAAAEQKWLLVGSVIGSKPQKKQHLGKEFDYLFDVDLGDNHPKLKLGYNKGEDPWAAAQRFINENELSQDFIDQISNFIVSQTKEVAHLYPSAAAADPFTGGSRYVPGSGVAGGGFSHGGAADPFTGSSGYRPGSGAPTSGSGASAGLGADPFTGSTRYVPAGQVLSTESVAASDFPVQQYLLFTQGNRKAMLDKLLTFQSEMKGEGAVIATVMHVIDAVDSSAVLREPEAVTGVKSLMSLLAWPEEKLLPVLDALRLAVTEKQVNRLMCEVNPDPVVKLFNDHIISSTQSSSTVANTNRMLLLRTVCNLFAHEPGRGLMSNLREQFINTLPNILPADKNTQIATASIFLNFGVQISQMPDSEAKDEMMLHTLRCVLDALGKLVDGEAVYRILAGLGTLIYESDFVSVAAELGVRDGVTKILSGAFPEKVLKCSERILAML